MAKAKKTYIDLPAIIQMAEQYGVDKNPLFIQTLNNYVTIQKAIEITDSIINEDDMTVSKEYVKGRENLYMHPAIKELPKQIDAANKTLDKLLDIIERLGNKSNVPDELMDYIKR